MAFASHSPLRDPQTNVPHLNLNKLNPNTSSVQPSAKGSYNQVNSSQSQKDYLSRDNIWESRRLETVGRVQSNMEELNNLLKEKQNPSYQNSFRSNEFNKPIGSRVFQYQQEISGYGGYPSYNDINRQGNFPKRSFHEVTLKTEFQNNQNPHGFSRNMGDYMFERDHNNQKYQGLKEQIIGKQASAVNLREVDNYSGLNERVPNIEGERLGRNRNRVIDNSKQEQVMPKGWNSMNYDVGILPHLHETNKKEKQREPLPEKMNNYNEHQKYMKNEYIVSQEGRKWDPYTQLNKEKEYAVSNRDRSNKTNTEDYRSYNVVGYGNSGRWENTGSSQTLKTIDPPRGQPDSFRPIDRKNYNPDSYAFSEEKLGYRETREQEKKEKQREMLKQTYLEQIEQNKKKKEMERQKMIEEELREKEKMKQNIQNPAKETKPEEEPSKPKPPVVDEKTTQVPQNDKTKPKNVNKELNKEMVVIKNTAELTDEGSELDNTSRYQPVKRKSKLEGVYEEEERNRNGSVPLDSGYPGDTHMNELEGIEELAPGQQEVHRMAKQTYWLREYNRNLQNELLKTSAMVKMKLESVRREDKILSDQATLTKIFANHYEKVAGLNAYPSFPILPNYNKNTKAPQKYSNVSSRSVSGKNKKFNNNKGDFVVMKNEKVKFGGSRLMGRISRESLDNSLSSRKSGELSQSGHFLEVPPNTFGRKKPKSPYRSYQREEVFSNSRDNQRVSRNLDDSQSLISSNRDFNLNITETSRNEAEY